MTEQVKAYVPARIRGMTMTDLACVVIQVQKVMEAFDAMRDRPTDERVAEFKVEMNRLRALAGFGTDPVEDHA